MFRHFFCGLSRERQKKIEEIRLKTERERSLMAGALFRLGLFRLYGLQEQTAVISYGARGKPFLRDYPHIHFNLSHSGEYALAVFAPTAVGCDIQQRERAKNEERIAARFFAPGERRALAEGEDFYRIWARKESYIKLTGEGMAADMQSVCVMGESSAACIACGTGESYGECGYRVTGRGEQSRCVPCRFADFELPDYCLSVCYAGAKSFPVVWIQAEQADFLV